MVLAACAPPNQEKIRYPVHRQSQEKRLSELEAKVTTLTTELAVTARHVEELEAKAAPSAELPEALDVAMIKDGIATAKELVDACTGTGQVKLRLVVSGAGRATEASVVEADDAKLGECVAAAARAAVFARTQHGATFVYPFTR